jgi:GNAT superfamily N-acetyltransferase
MKVKKQKNNICAVNKRAVPPFHQKAIDVRNVNQVENTLNILKLETIDTAKLEYRVLTKLAEKKKWQQRFRKAYREPMLPDLDTHYGENIKFIVASADGRDVGFLRLADVSFRFSSLTDLAAWNICDGYVKPAYQSQGVLGAMVKNAVQQHSAKSLTIDTDRFLIYRRYYARLGFTHHRYVGNTNCSRIYLTSWEPIITAIIGPKHQ